MEEVPGVEAFFNIKAQLLKMKGRVYASCVRICMLYGFVTWPLRNEDAEELKKD